MQRPVRIGLIGLGRFGPGFHLRRLLALGPERVRIAGLCDRSPERLAGFDTRFPEFVDGLDGCPRVTDAADLVDPGRVDGVIVSTPNPHHAAPCRLAIERGVPVLVDKPTTVTAAEAAALVELSRAHDVPFLTAFTRRFFPAAIFLRDRVGAGAVGDLTVIQALQLGCPPNDRPQDGGFLHQRCVHLFDLAPWIAGSPITRVEARVRYEGPWETFADMRLYLGSGTEVHFLSLSDTAQNQDEVSLYGTHESYRLQRETLFVNRQRGPWEPFAELPEAADSATTHFVDVVAGRVTPGAEAVDRHGADGLRAMQVLEAVVTSGRTGQPVELPA